MSRKLAVAIFATACLVLPSTAAAAPPQSQFTPGAPGIGDPYFPLDGNGGYDVQHYDLKVTYDPATDVLTGEATITAKATQNLSQFDLDYLGPTLSTIRVNGVNAGKSRSGQELTVKPRDGIVSGSTFTVVARYQGVPQEIQDGSGPGFIHTDDGAIVQGEPHGASTWFPANDHPRDKASFTLHITAPTGLEVTANGVLTSHHDNGGGWTTWDWDEPDPMATYLATFAIGEFAVRSFASNGRSYVNAVDERFMADISPAVTPVAGAQFLYSQIGDASFKRLTRTVDVPPGGATLSFQANADTEPGWDFLFVEARTAGGDDWTTLPDLNGHTSQDVGFCPYTWWDLHPFFEHYLTPFIADPGDPSTPDDDIYSCTPSGTSGDWNARTGPTDGWESWSVQIPNAGGTTRSVEVSISYSSDFSFQLRGVVLDEIIGPGGQGSTGFENDGNVMDGWVAPIAGPAGSPDNPNTWVVTDNVPAVPGDGPRMFHTLEQLPAILDFESNLLGAYPWSAAGGVIDDAGVFFALENQTRPTYSPVFWSFGDDPTWVVAHENAHQWFGDLVSVDSWQFTWLNEGFATYMQWLWVESIGFDSPEVIFEDGATIPADDPFWELPIGDPGVDCLFCGEIYFRGAMTLQALRNEVGTNKFFKILRAWIAANRNSTGSIREFIDIAESIAKKDLDPLFAQWLGSGKPTIGMPSPKPGPHGPVNLRTMPKAIQDLALVVPKWYSDRFRDPKAIR